MSQKSVFALWGGLFVVCAGLGFVPESGGALRLLLTLAALLFFLPPAVVLYRAGKAGDSATLKLVRNLSSLSLVLTLVLLIANFLTALHSEALGTFLHYLLIVVSSPMFCSGYWALSLFLWACLLMVSLQLLKKSKQKHLP